ncbi:YciI family protein [Kordiimonas sp.]|uniref:YciI family protein n=1 Tax=Kordiimonas sp. TaxID=1970157 RepID=UPI003A9407B7
MYIILLTFSDNKASAAKHMDGHKSWIKKGIEDGIFLIVGSLQPNRGGAIIAHNIEADALAHRIKEDPFVVDNVVKAEIMEVTPSAAHERVKFLLG